MLRVLRRRSSLILLLPHLSIQSRIWVNSLDLMLPLLSSAVELLLHQSWPLTPIQLSIRVIVWEIIRVPWSDLRTHRVLRTAGAGRTLHHLRLIRDRLVVDLPLKEQFSDRLVGLATDNRTVSLIRAVLKNRTERESHLSLLDGGFFGLVEDLHDKLSLRGQIVEIDWFGVPDGFSRLALSEGSWGGHWLRLLAWEDVEEWSVLCVWRPLWLQDSRPSWVNFEVHFFVRFLLGLSVIL